MAALLKNSLSDALHLTSNIFLLEFQTPEQTGIIPSVIERNCVVSQFLHCVVCQSLEGLETPSLRSQLQTLNGAMPIIY